MTIPKRNRIAPIGKVFPLDDSGWLEFFSRWYIWLSLAAIVFAALALLSSNGIRIYSKRVGATQAGEIAEARRQAAVANAGAATANAKASDANARVKEAEAQIASANAASRDAVAKVATAEARIAEANRAAAEANRISEHERLERIRLEALVAPRRLSEEQQRSIADGLKQFSGRRVIVRSYGLDGEGTALGMNIIAALTLSGIVVENELARFLRTGGFDLGVHINGPVEQQDFVTALAAQLSSTGKLAVSINAPTSNGGISGSAISGSAISAGSTIPGGPRPTGEPVTIMVGLRPFDVVLPQ
jgi:hypothetical protein